jgi:hypothetical protein
MGAILDQGKWGVCGFVGVLNGLHQAGRLKEFGTELFLDPIKVRLRAGMITDLAMTEVGRPAIAAGILAFIRSFGHPDSTDKSVDDICTRIAAEPTTIATVEDWTNNQGGIGVGLPPHAAEDDLRVTGLTPARKTVVFPPVTRDALPLRRNRVIGLGRNPHSAPDNGLKHRVFVDGNGVPMNWGKQNDLTKEPLPQPMLDETDDVSSQVIAPA